MDNNKNNVSVYKRGADDGFWFGIYLSVLIILCFSSVNMPLLSMPAIILALGVPVVIFFFLKRAYNADNRQSIFSALWLQGICTFFFGSLIMAVTVYVYLRFINPSYFPDGVSSLIDMYDQADVSDTTYELLTQMKKNSIYPTPGQTAVELIWAAVFTGSLLSMLITFIIRTFNKRNN